MSGPARLMVELLGSAVIVGAALIYGNHWRATAEDWESQVLEEDRLLLELYRKVEQLEKRNEQLLDEVRRLETQSRLQEE